MRIAKTARVALSNGETITVTFDKVDGTRTVRRIIFEHFDYFVSEWNRFEARKNG